MGFWQIPWPIPWGGVTEPKSGGAPNPITFRYPTPKKKDRREEDDDEDVLVMFHKLRQ